jgi:hypothetical protein
MDDTQQSVTPKKRGNRAAAPEAPAAAPEAPAAAPEAPAAAPEAPAAAPEAPPAPAMFNPPEPEPEPPTTFSWDAPSHFQKIPQDFLIYSPDRCDGRSILSIPLDVIDLPRDKSTIKALVCMLLEPTLLVDADGTAVEGRVGQEVLVECGHFLRRLIRAAMDPRNVGEVWMRPIGKLRGEGGDAITLWDIRYGKTYPRDKVKRSGR